MELDGDSLRASRLISRAIRELGVDIPLLSLFQASKVADMALIVTQGHAAHMGYAELALVLADLESMPEQARRLLVDQEKRL